MTISYSSGTQITLANSVITQVNSCIAEFIIELSALIMKNQYKVSNINDLQVDILILIHGSIICKEQTKYLSSTSQNINSEWWNRSWVIGKVTASNIISI